MVKKGDHIFAENVKEAKSFKDRAIGLMFSSQMEGFDGLMIEPCTSIHTFFMNYPIDVVFLNKDNKVVKVIENMKPWRLSSFYFRANKVLELMGGTLKNRLNKDDQLEVLCTN